MLNVNDLSHNLCQVEFQLIFIGLLNLSSSAVGGSWSSIATQSVNASINLFSYCFFLFLFSLSCDKLVFAISLTLLVTLFRSNPFVVSDWFPAQKNAKFVVLA